MTENDSFTKNIPHATANVHKNKNGLGSPFVVEMRGFEPLAYALRTHCSTN